MLCFGILAATVALAAAEPQPFHNFLKVNLSPEEAAKYLNMPPFTKPKVRFNDQSFRSAEAGPTNGRSWRNGFENTDDDLEEVHDVSQFHGQDGLGAYTYGYKTPQSAKVENRQRSGDLHGEYRWRPGPNSDLIKVRYWQDSEGFHQEDNLPKPQEQARLVHEKAWQEAAAGSRPQSEYYYDLQPQGSASEQQEYYAKPNQAYQYGARSTPAPTGQGGFFYSFNHPVSGTVPENKFQDGAQTSYPVNYAQGSINYNI